ncbi:hypothetical protein LMG28688_02553 [Paraburkholderia caffeinitolerans]|uniref:diguanylate cyclase n=1 Tax=Paraburkholderia caffeinitolerans TaxID=1723730 RepID=A0A6J5G0T5_9BURK|nr:MULTISPECIES: sensor domain-containing diguanylate cyclase [Paraburkholderia]CAB3787828.1 hypothetical protein LMG28688_02553 [Paraburkholderia caffeinitolerans]
MKTPRWSGMAATALLAAAIATALVVAVRAELLYESRRAALEHARDANRTLVLLASRIIERDISACTRALQTLDASMPAIETPAMHTCLARFVATESAAAPGKLAQAMVMDAAGNIVQDSADSLACHVGLADEPFFKLHSKSPQPSVQISAPFRSCLLDGARTIALSRRLSAADGRFAGVALVAINIGYFNQLFADLAPGTQGGIAVLRDDGVPIMRNAFVRGDLGFGHADVFRHFIVHPGGDFVDYSDVTAGARLYHYRFISAAPLLIVVSASGMDMFADWRRRAMQVGVLTAGFGAGCFMLAVMLIRQQRRRVQAEEELERAIKTDPLTHLPNRRALDDTVASEWTQAARENTELAVLFIDVDYFEAYHDRYGRLAGDETLSTVGRVITRALRQSGGTAGRYDGEVFMAVLPRTPLHAAIEIAEEIGEAVRRCDIPHADNASGKVTVSIGVATRVPSLDSDGNALMREADEALYAAKAEGRDRVASNSMPSDIDNS